MWYRSTFSKKIFNSSSIDALNIVLGDTAAGWFIAHGMIIPIKDPSVIDILKDNGSEVLAMIRYRDIHGCTLSEAREMVKRIMLDMGMRY